MEMIEPSPFVAQCGTNYVPTDDEITQIEKLIQKPTLQLELLETRMEAMRSMLKQLELEHEVLLCAIQRYRALLSPMRRIPIDILQEVFTYCVPSEHNASMCAEEAPILLTQVCSSWRQIALRTPRLWATIHIAITPKAQGSNFDPDDAKYPLMANHLSALRLAAVHKWLRRTGAAPLFISLDDLEASPAHRYDSKLLNRFIDSAIAYSAQWKEISIAASFRTTDRITHLSASEVPLLESLKIKCGALRTIMTPDNKDHVWMNSGLLRAPHLTEVAFTHLNEDITQFPINWSQITRLCLDGNPLQENGWITISKVTRLMKACHSLTSCRFEMSSRDRGIAVPGIISLPFLDTLSLHVATNMSGWLEQLNLPVLRKIEYYRCHRGTPSLLSLLSRTTSNVQFLVIDVRAFTPNDLLKCLLCCPFLRSMRIQPYVGAIENPTARIDDSLLRRMITGDATNVCLLPRLEEFECRTAVTFSDNSLLDCILSNQGGGAMGKTVLKHVSVFFDRPRKIDILPEITPHIIAGLKLKLEYAPQSIRNPSSLNRRIANASVDKWIPWLD
ncbi:hypothetical protein B0H34DRAFT_180458 [Crassisporium funariophilum]|nr:hypothetical protein B0H34DRAFT_180458 [Crassisporium funariophilum]